MVKKEYNRAYTGMVNALLSNQVFVFGSNINGFHFGGAAHVAHRRFGAEWGVGDGVTGRCYAIPTMEGDVDYVKGYVDKFIAYAKQHPEQEFLVTRIGCGIAGFRDSDIAPLFREALPVENVLLPKEFVELL